MTPDEFRGLRCGDTVKCVDTGRLFYVYYSKYSIASRKYTLFAKYDSLSDYLNMDNRELYKPTLLTRIKLGFRGLKYHWEG